MSTVLAAQSAGHIADHSPPSGVKVKDVWSYTSTLPYAFRLQCLLKHRNNFTLCCCIPDTRTLFEENYFHRMFRNNDSIFGAETWGKETTWKTQVVDGSIILR
jgi:hypothetical protein